MEGVEEKSLVWGKRWVSMVDKAKLEIMVLLWCGNASYYRDTVIKNQEMINKIVIVQLIKKTTPLGL